MPQKPEEEVKAEEYKAAKAAAQPTKLRCTHGPNQRCPNCMDENDGLVSDRKHEPFDGYIKN